jgi:ssDNA-binding Zn-finger/Zn-ribbon topoisomerase 1
MEFRMSLYCPKCNSPMTIRERRKAPGNRFYGCSRYPKCKGTREIVEGKKDINQKIVSNLHKVVKSFRCAGIFASQQINCLFLLADI